MSVKDWLDVVRFLLDLVADAALGSDESQKKLDEILPDELKTSRARARQDALDSAKFGPRS